MYPFISENISKVRYFKSVACGMGALPNLESKFSLNFLSMKYDPIFVKNFFDLPFELVLKYDEILE